MIFKISPTSEIAAGDKSLVIAIGHEKVSEEEFRKQVKLAVDALMEPGEEPIEKPYEQLTEKVFRTGINIGKQNFKISGKGEFKPIE